MAEPTELEGRATSCQPAGLFLSWTMTRQCSGASNGCWDFTASIQCCSSSSNAMLTHDDFENALCFIFDIDLNGESGLDLCHCLENRGVRLPVIYITGNDSEANRAAATRVGLHRLPDQAICRTVAHRTHRKSARRRLAICLGDPRLIHRCIRRRTVRSCINLIPGNSLKA